MRNNHKQVKSKCKITRDNRHASLHRSNPLKESGKNHLKITSIGKPQKTFYV